MSKTDQTAAMTRPSRAHTGPNRLPRTVRLAGLAACMLLGGLPAAAQAASPARILSMAPSTTEILFALGLGPRVVGITRFCDYPPDAQSLPRVGGYTDPNYEQIVRLQPDLTILLDTQADVQRQLSRLGLQTLLLPHATIDDIHTSIRMIGAACGAEAQASQLLAGLQQRQAVVADAIEARTGKPRPRVLVCIGRDLSAGKLVGLYMAGRNGFYDELLEMAGAVNAYRDSNIPYPQLSAEGIIHLDPDVILDLIRALPETRSADEVRADWDSLASVAAVRHGRVHIMTGDAALRPGPRYISFLEQLAEVLGDATGEWPHE